MVIYDCCDGFVAEFSNDDDDAFDAFLRAFTANDDVKPSEPED